MAADLKLGSPEGDGWLIAESDVFKATASDVMIDNPARRKTSSAFRRAFVHDFDDGLTINFAGDYPGGVTINSGKVQNAMLNLHIVTQDVDIDLPAQGNPGDVLVLHQTSSLPEFIPQTSVWICVPSPNGIDLIPGAWWARIPLADAVQGTA